MPSLEAPHASPQPPAPDDAPLAAARLSSELAARLLEQNRPHEALPLLQRALALRPHCPEATLALAQGLESAGLLDSALTAYATAVRLHPSHAALHGLGTALFQSKAFAPAIDAFRKALTLAPASLPTLHNLGTALLKTHAFEEAASLLAFVTQHQPSWSSAWLHLATALRELGRIPEALEASRNALALAPLQTEPLLERAACLLRSSDAPQAFDCFQKALALTSSPSPSLLSDLLYSSNYVASLSPKERFRLHQTFEHAFPPSPTHAPSPKPPSAKLRIGYVSGDFCLHSVAFFIEPIFKHHDPSQFEVFAYSNRPRQDKISDHLRSLVPHWREVHSLSDDAMAALIRHDQIDILVDLSGHTARNRLPVFARKPAPLQITTIGCMQTTGLSAIDYRLSDPLLDPPGRTESLHSEALLRLPSRAFCFAPPPNSPPVAPSPVASSGRFTFACFHNSAKLHLELLQLWARILLATPSSRILLLGETINLPALTLQSLGVPPSQIVALPRQNLLDYLQSHAEVDLLLDPFPYSGLTVPLFAAWMGVPSLTLEGDHSVARSCACILSHLQLPHLIAHSQEEYVSKAVAFARAPRSLPDRSQLRAQVAALYTDGPRFVRELETALRSVWNQKHPASPTSDPAPSDLLPNAQTLLDAGLLPEAAQALDSLLLRFPDHLPTLRARARCALQNAQPHLARNFLQKALSLAPSDPESLWQLAELEHSHGDPLAAEPLYRDLASLLPSDPKSHAALALLCEKSNRPSDAEFHYRKALQLAPESEPLRLSLAGFLFNLGNRFEAVLQTLAPESLPHPTSAIAHSLRGVSFMNLGQHLRASECLREAIASDPSKIEPRTNLGGCLVELHQPQAAVDLLLSALRLSPQNSAALANLGSAYRLLGDFPKAESVALQTIQIAPHWFVGYLNLGSVLVQLGRNQEAITHFRKAFELNPDSQTALSNLIFCLNYEEDVSPEQVFAEYRRFSTHFETPLLASHLPHPNTPDPDRRLKIGYVSADLRDHSVHYFAEPLLRNHSQNAFEVFVYHNHPLEDPTSSRLRSLVDHWRPVHGISDESLARQIRADQIDILIDLSGHTAANRMLAFARKPAPIQLTMIGCMQSSGLQSMDYRITDLWMDPPGATEHLHSESLLRLDSGAFCLQPIADAPEVSPLPALSNGFVTFGSFNNLAKLKPRVLSLWARILALLPSSKLLLVGRNPESTLATFQSLGIPPERILPVGLQDRANYLRLHHQVDLLLDTFPYTGLTINSIAAWMGLPSVTMEGHSAAARAGAAILRRLQLPHWIASTDEDYIRIALGAASDLPSLAQLRASLRSRALLHLANTQAHVAEFESHLRGIWKTWCASRSGSPTPL